MRQFSLHGLFKWLLVLFLFIGAGIRVSAQDTASSTSLKKQDSTGLGQALKHGRVTKGWRYYFMATDNDRKLTDFYAHALGMHLKYETGSFRGFKLGIDGSITARILSTDLSVPDSTTKNFARYETGLFDMEDLDAPTLARLEELYLAYGKKGLSITGGRQLLNTPFINLQDGRMRPTAVSGIYIQNKGNKTTMELGYISSILPRSTGRWFSTDASIGLYSQGLNSQGQPSDYAGHLHSNGIVLAGITHKLNPGATIQFWNQAVTNIFNTLLVQFDFRQNTDSLQGFTAGIQAITQQRLGSGGNADHAHEYFPQGNHPFVLSSRLGWFYRHWNVSLNYTRVTRAGQYLMPREWGKDPFYTFLPRERNSGYGGVDALVARISITKPAHGFSLSLDGGYFHMPGKDDFRLNRYGMPSYYQLNMELKHRFVRGLKGLEVQLLYVYKIQADKEPLADRYVFNKVNMSSYNVVFNYTL